MSQGEISVGANYDVGWHLLAGKGKPVRPKTAGDPGIFDPNSDDIISPP